MNKRQRKKIAKRRQAEKERLIKEKAYADFNEAYKRLCEVVAETANAIGECIVEAANYINAELNKQQKQG